jgi:DNA sulfur modification protein DndB
MALVVPAIRSKMGSTEYFETKMQAGELASSVRSARESDVWGSAIEERIQRDLNRKRVESDIIPYLLRSEDRFFGSLIVLVEPGPDGEMTFEDFRSVGSKVPAAYSAVAKDLGFLTIDDSDLVVLDGQHRLAALRQVVQRELPEDLAELADLPADSVARDEVSVIFIRYESNEKTRRIFNKVNRYAKTTSRSDNIITSEDDGYAIVARRLVDDGAALSIIYKGDLIVEWKSNTIAKRSTKLTTISAVYETVRDIVHAEGLPPMDELRRVVRPSDEELDSAFEAAETWWGAALTSIEVLRVGAEDPKALPSLRSSDRQNLLLRPNGQIALFKGVGKARENGLDIEQAFSRANQVDWSTESDLWRNILVKPSGSMIARTEAYDVAGRLVSYLIGPRGLSRKEKADLQRQYATIREGLQDDLETDLLPELPEPVGQSSRR